MQVYSRAVSELLLCCYIAFKKNNIYLLYVIYEHTGKGVSHQIRMGYFKTELLVKILLLIIYKCYLPSIFIKLCMFPIN